MYLWTNAVLLLLALPVTFASPTDVTLQSREPEPMEVSLPEASLPESLPKIKSEDPSPPVTEASSAVEGAPKDKLMIRNNLMAAEIVTGNSGPRMNMIGLEMAGGVVAIDSTGHLVALVKRKGASRWHLPKRRYEQDDNLITDAIKLESRLNVGVDGTVGGVVLGHVVIGRSTDIAYYELRNAQSLEEWRGQNEWERTWATYKEAGELLEDAREMGMIGNSGLKRYPWS